MGEDSARFLSGWPLNQESPKDMTASLVPLEQLRQRAQWVWRQTIEIHMRAPETRVASSLSAVETLVCLFYGGLLRHDPRQPQWSGRDRLIISKAHGAIAMYPILADRGYFPLAELERVARNGSILGGIPDPIIPGFETVNGSLGHGPGVACGMALALKRSGNAARVIVLVGDGELHEGSTWEAIMFAGHHRLDNLLMIVDCNTRCMLNNTDKVNRLEPLAPKFTAFGWTAQDCDGHDLGTLYPCLAGMLREPKTGPSVLVAHTVKGHGVPSLEASPICHVLSIQPDEYQRLPGGAS
jgi:transketolase